MATSLAQFIASSRVQSTAAGYVWNYPAGTQQGDLLTMMIDTTTIPTGWTQAGTASNNVRIVYRFAGTETSVTLPAATTAYGAVMAVHRGIKNAAPVRGTAGTGTGWTLPTRDPYPEVGITVVMHLIYNNGTATDTVNEPTGNGFIQRYNQGTGQYSSPALIHDRLDEVADTGTAVFNHNSGGGAVYYSYISFNAEPDPADSKPTRLATSSLNTILAYSNQRKVDRTSNGVLWAMDANGGFYYSLDDGATWTTYTVSTANVSNGSLFIDIDDYAHHAYRNASDGYVYYRRGTPNAGRTAWTWSTPIVIGQSTGYQVPDIVAHKEGTGWKAHIVASFSSTTENQVQYSRVDITSAGAITREIISQNSPNYNKGNAGIWTWPSIDFHHTGDGKTVAGGTPHLYIAWTSGGSGAGNGIAFKKMVYSGGTWTAPGTTGHREIDTTRYVSGASNWLNCLYDGTRAILVGKLYDGSTSDVMLYERDAADTITTTRLLLDNPTGADALFYGGATYDGQGNVYLLGRDNLNNAARYRKWDRAALSLGASQVVATNSIYSYFSAKRGHSDGRVEFIWTYSGANPYSIMFDSLLLNAPPNAPGLVAPANSATIDLSGTVLFDWTFNDPDAGDTQGAWAFRRKVSGAASYEYWNVSTAAWQATEVWNSGSTTEYTFPAGSWSNGTSYNWSVATRDALGATGPYASDFTVNGGQPPSVTVDAPTGTVVISRPTVSWTFFDPAGGSQVTYQVKVYDSATYTAGGFDPNTTTALWNSGEVSSSSVNSRTIGVDLTTGTTYRAYVRVKDDEGIYSQWAYSQFSVALSPPNVPSITVTDDPTNARVIIDVQGHDNLFSEDSASFETGTGSWGNNNNVTIARSTAQAADGVASLSMTAVAAGAMGAYSPAIAAVAGQVYTFIVSFRGATTGRTVRVDGYFYDSGGATIGSFGADGADTTTGWTQIVVTGTAPVGTATTRIVARITGAGTTAGEVHYIDKAGIIPGNVTTWARGGLAASTAFIVERSIDGGITWETVRGTEGGQPHDGAPTQKLRVLDREMGPGTTVTYRAKTTVEV